MSPRRARSPRRPPGASVPLDLYARGALRRPPGLVLVHGLSAEGKDDPRLRDAARLLARAGWAVAVPTVEGLTVLRLRPEDAAAVRRERGGAARRRIPARGPARHQPGRGAGASGRVGSVAGPAALRRPRPRRVCLGGGAAALHADRRLRVRRRGGPRGRRAGAGHRPVRARQYRAARRGGPAPRGQSRPGRGGRADPGPAPEHPGPAGRALPRPEDGQPPRPALPDPRPAGPGGAVHGKPAARRGGAGGGAPRAHRDRGGGRSRRGRHARRAGGPAPALGDLLRVPARRPGARTTSAGSGS